MKLSTILLLLPAAVVFAGQPISNLSVTLRGKKFDVEEATSVQDVLGQIKDAAGVDGRLLFGGRQLAATDDLEAMGVKEGDSLQMVPASTSKKAKSKSSSSSSAVKPAAADAGAGGGMPGMPDMSELLKGLGGDGGGGMPDMSELLKGAGGAGGGMPDMSESMDMMANMMNSPMFQEYMSDPEKLEASRQMILSNPLMKQMMANMPGMAEILEDKDAWREAMTAAATMYKEMDPEVLKQAMMGNMPPGAGGGMPDMSGMFGGEASALDELSEGED